MTRDAEQRRRIASAIREYDAQGWHRTGTAVDHASGEWLAGLAANMGLEPTLEPFPLRRIDSRHCYVEIEGRRVAGLPLFDGGFTDAEGVSGRLKLPGDDADIDLVEVAPGGGDLEAARRPGRDRAVVAVTIGGAPGLAVRNAPDFLAPFGPPVLQVAGEERWWLAERAAHGSLCRVVAHVERTPAQAYNVVAALAGADSSLPPLLVMTPRSGWWCCAAERGGGIACWLEVMRALAEAGTAHDVMFLATTGHELGHLGLEAFLRGRPALAKGALAWMHLGASIGAALEPGLHLLASDDELKGLTRDAITGAEATMPEVAPRGTVPGGEARNVHERGGRYLSLAGGHALFHLESDRWPSAVDVDSVARYARALASVAAQLAGR